MFTLRFQRQGKKKDFVFRVVATDSHWSSTSGKAKEILGWWNPRRDTFELKKERILYWIQEGAQPSDSCYNLLIRAKIIEGKKRPIAIHKKKSKKGEEVKAEEKKQETETEVKADEAKEVPEENKEAGTKEPEEIKSEPITEDRPEKKKEEVINTKLEEEKMKQDEKIESEIKSGEKAEKKG